MTTNRSVEAVALEIVQWLVEEMGYYADWTAARERQDSSWMPEHYDLLDGDVQLCRERGVEPDAVLPRVRELLEEAMDACKAAEAAGRESAVARLDEQGWPTTADGLRKFAGSVAFDGGSWGELDGEKIIGHAFAVRLARRAELARLSALADDADAATDLIEYGTAEVVRGATPEEAMASIRASFRDGGAGVIVVDGRSCYAGS